LGRAEIFFYLYVSREGKGVSSLLGAQIEAGDNLLEGVLSLIF
jgi:hypothetical protein